MSRAAFEAKLTALEALRSTEDEPTRNAALAKALDDRNNYIAAKAANIITEIRAQTFIPKLLTNFERFLTNPAKTDPQCWAKIALIKAISTLGHEDPEIYIQALRHVQWEPVWGGQEDTAGPLRAHATLALTQCRNLSDLDTLEYLLEALIDRDKTVRVEAARAMGRIDRREAALLLRHRALTGDSEPEPLAAIYSALLAIEGARAISFLARFLDDPGDAGQEAALALGSTHNPAALQVLRSALERCRDPTAQATLLSSIALTRLPEALEFLIQEVEAGSRPALDALAAAELNVTHRARLNEILSQAHLKRWG